MYHWPGTCSRDSCCCTTTTRSLIPCLQSRRPNSAPTCNHTITTRHNRLERPTPSIHSSNLHCTLRETKRRFNADGALTSRALQTHSARHARAGQVLAGRTYLELAHQPRLSPTSAIAHEAVTSKQQQYDGLKTVQAPTPLRPIRPLKENIRNHSPIIIEVRRVQVVASTQPPHEQVLFC